MSQGIKTITFFLYFLFLLQMSIGHRKVMHEGGLNSHLELPRNQEVKNPDTGLEPELNVFFHYNTLEPGKKILVYFPTPDPSTTPRLLSRQESDSIPFSSSQLPYLLQFFSFPVDSKQALAMKSTLHHCELPPLSGEAKFCATSLESLLDSIGAIFGPSYPRFKVMTTNYLTGPVPSLQNYTVSESPKEIQPAKMMGCHKVPYPYAVFYCHGQAWDRKLYSVFLDGENGVKIEALAMCHMDTSEWDPEHLSFRVLGTVPGASPVCHFFPPDNLVWIPGN